MTDAILKSSVAKNTSLNEYFQQKIFNDIIKKTNTHNLPLNNGATLNVNNDHDQIDGQSKKYKSYHSKLLEKKLDDGWNRMRGKMKKFVDYDAPNSDDSSDCEDNYESSYSYKFLFESSTLPKWNRNSKREKDLSESK